MYAIASETKNVSLNVSTLKRCAIVVINFFFFRSPGCVSPGYAHENGKFFVFSKQKKKEIKSWLFMQVLHQL